MPDNTIPLNLTHDTARQVCQLLLKDGKCFEVITSDGQCVLIQDEPHNGQLEQGYYGFMFDRYHLTILLCHRSNKALLLEKARQKAPQLVAATHTKIVHTDGNVWLISGVEVGAVPYDEFQVVDNKWLRNGTVVWQ